MRFPFKELPGRSDDEPRPVVPVAIDGLPQLRLPSLVDSGSLGNRFARWVADAASIDLRDAEVGRIAVAGLVVDTWTAPVPLALGEVTWQAPVSFCDPWPFDFSILGQEGFLRFFRVTIRAAVYETACEPED